MSTSEPGPERRRRRTVRLLLVLVGCQVLFTVCDLLARSSMRSLGFHPTSFPRLWFVIYLLAFQIATLGQLFVLSRAHVGKSMAMFGAASIVISNVLGVLLLGEVLSPPAYLGCALAATALMVMAIG